MKRTRFNFERLTSQITNPALAVFKTIKAFGEDSATLDSKHNSIVVFVYVKNTSPVSAKFNARANLGRATVKGGNGLQRFRRRKVLTINYDAPSKVIHRGKSDHVIIEVKYAGTLATHRVSVLLL